MKVECFTINQQNRKERIGYLLLSLRSIQIAATGKSTNVSYNFLALARF